LKHEARLWELKHRERPKRTYTKKNFVLGIWAWWNKKEQEENKTLTGSKLK
jgi:hypothetical protein